MKDLGAPPRTLLENFLKEVFKTFKNFNEGNFRSCPYILRILMWPDSVLRIPAATSQIPSSGIWTAVASLRYRIETVGKLHLNGAERHTGRSLQHHILRVTSDGFRTPTGAQSEGSAPQINPPSVRQLTPYHFYPVAGARRQPTKSRWSGFCAGAAGMRSTANGYTQNLHNVKRESKIQIG